MSNPKHRGGCFCGALKFEVAGEATSRCICHCASCRASSGAPFIAWSTFAAPTFRILAGQLSEHHSSPGVTRGFCAICGTSVTYAHAERPDEIDISTTTLAEAGRLAPDRHIWVADKVPWLSINDGLPQYANWSTTQ